MLTDKVALITGATGGAGPTVVQALADAGASIVATSRDPADLIVLHEETAVPAARWLSRPAELTDPAATQALVDAARNQFGHVDILVALAGGWRGGATVAASDLGLMEWLWRTNLVTAFNTCRSVLPGMISQGWGRIITAGSRSATVGQARSGPYAASKAAVVALTQSIALETRDRGVTANALLISTLDTPVNRHAMPDADPDRWVAPAQLAATILFLCSDEAAAINGAAIPVYARA
jgi:NAD(P)-dependent dehydrogenase (short-subunit alcohol dehydrogenase family)